MAPSSASRSTSGRRAPAGGGSCTSPRSTSTVNDLAGWRKTETPSFDRSCAYCIERPSWEAEILSPSTESLDRLKKLRAYHQGGIGWVWLVHPEHRSIEVYAHREEGYLLLETHEGDETASVGPFAAIPLELPTLWM